MEQYTGTTTVKGSPETEHHSGSIEVEFKGMPSIKLQSYRPEHKQPRRRRSVLEQLTMVAQRLAIATQRRRFTLEKDWILELDGINYKNGLNGKVKIPIQHASEDTPIVFDGASIPLPWLISLLTIGILRPLGVTLIASIVHDYAYMYGTLPVASHGSNTFQELPIERHTADHLFRDIVGTINHLPPVGYIAWLAIRIGWIWVPYANEQRNGNKPCPEYLFILFIVGVIYALIATFGLNTLLIALLIIYLSAYVLSLLLQRFMITSD